MRRLLPLLFICLLILSALYSLTVGAFDASIWQVVQALFSQQGTASAAEAQLIETVVWSIRLPRVIMAVLVGAALSIAGAALQGLFRNPLADPGLIGVSSGGALGAVIVIVLGPLLPMYAHLAGFLLPAAAFIGGVVVTLFIYRIARSGGRTEVATMLLAGIAVNALSGAVIGTLIFTASDDQIRSFTFWSLGSLAQGTWPLLGFGALFIVPGLLLLPLAARPLNAFLLGEAEAYQLGYDTQRMKRMIIVLSAGMVGASVALSGIIGFVGLVVPHLLRLSFGPDHRLLLPLSALTGATLLIWADMAARVWAQPAELPIGILTALIGAPFFLGLLLKAKHRFG